MPGDRLAEQIQIRNEAADCDAIRVYMKAVCHDEEENPLTYDERTEYRDGKDQAEIEGERDETTATMQDFLSQLTMRIYQGEQLIYDAAPHENGALAEYVLLGTLRRGETLSLRVELDVPLELGNAYANRVGEVDWVFIAESITDSNSLIQTGQLHWPILVLGILGSVLLLVGVLLFVKGKKKNV